MDVERYARVRALFEQVCDLPAPQRQARLAASGADEATLASVQALLEREQATTRHMDRPILGLLGAMAADECEPGDVLGAWTLLRRIGHGGMGSVYLAQRSDGHFEQTAAIKVLRGVPSPAALAYLARERQILARLAHPNIARLLDGGATPQGQPYLVMEYLDGMPIDAYCREVAPSVTAILRLLCTVCDAVGFAHQRLIVHCDLKPTNILVDASGRPMLLDFGIARLLGHEDGADTQTTKAFTPGYASPEQRDGGSVSTATDIYSLGRMLVELLNTPAAPAAGDAAIEPASLADQELRAIAVKATAADPARRYASADALAQDIGRYLQRQPVQAMAATGLYRARKFLRRRWPWVATFAVFAATIAAFTVRVVADRDRAEAAEQQALRERDRALQAQASSRQISEFLVSVFDGSHPDAGSGEIPTSKLVEQSLQRIDSELKGQPATQAELYATLAGVQRVLGNAEQSRAHFDKAIALQRTLDDPLVLAGMLSKRAMLSRASFGRDGAVADAREALALTERHAAPGSAAVAAAVGLLGRTLSDDHQHALAQPLLLRALALHEALDPSGAGSIDLLEALGLHFQSKGEYPQAAVYFQRIADIDLKLKGPNSREYYADLESLGTVYGLMRRFDDAEATLRRAMDGFRQLDGEDSAEMAWHLSQLGRVIDNSGRARDAIPVYRQALEIGARKMGVDSVSYAVLLNNLAVAQRRSGDFAAAERSYAQALPIMEKNWPASDATLNRVGTDFGNLLLAAGKLDAAHQRLSTALRNKLAASDEHAAPVLLSHIAMAEWESRSGQPGRALARLQKIAVQAELLDTLDRAAYARQLGLAQAGQGQAELALQALQKAEQLTRQLLGEHDPRSWLVMLDRAEVLAAQATTASRAAAAQLAAQILHEVDAALVADSPLRAQLARLAAADKR
ncbi:serine/threonine-protein kinase [Tahibacter aquaticus]|uniref:Serine/threonine-protein kinase n=1 Tax=Tahibacter aquaticus TaxID=520092 RepID=A0A4R6YGR6_9GAMM|nr:serine/threonine-protein kinase [Tahibacter aquaticus]TDR35818.1 serine/threonine-protein kinase [Tahibacter aquaticus]